MSKSAIILGATGLTGSLVLKALLENNKYDTIKLFSRKSCGINNPKIKEFIVDVIDLESSKEDFIADEVYCCIGTTKKKTPSQEVYTTIDFGIPATAARLAKANNVETMIVISAIGADPKSSFFYNRTKGNMEKAVFDAGIPRTYILRPSIITGNREEKRFGEKIGAIVFKIIRPFFFGKLKKYRAVEADSIAKKMIELANSKELSRVVESDEI